MVQPLSQKFNWWLGSLLFDSRHIQIVNKDNQMFSEGWTQSTASTFFQFALDCLLGKIGGSFCAEANCEVHKVFLIELAQVLLCRSSFSCARPAHKQERIGIFGEHCE